MFTRAGYVIEPFVHDFLVRPALDGGTAAMREIPQVRTQLSWRDVLGTLRARLGFFRGNYAIAPGLYAVGEPDAAAPVLVTANYKLSFDALRSELSGCNVWLLVLDTRGINVWCAAGKDLFSTKELVGRIRRTALEQVVSHRRLILPQLAAPGVSAVAVRRATGFTVTFGPVRARDLPGLLPLLQQGGEPGAQARTVTFTLRERAVLIPVEITLRARPLAVALGLGAVLTGLAGPGPFWEALAMRFPAYAAFTLGGLGAGIVLVPLLLPWIPGRMFGVKGALAGGAMGLLAGYLVGVNGMTSLTLLGGILWCAGLASFLATNFTGSTPFTSPSGVEKELRRCLPLQALSALVGLSLLLMY